MEPLTFTAVISLHGVETMVVFVADSWGQAVEGLDNTVRRQRGVGATLRDPIVARPAAMGLVELSTSFRRVSRARSCACASRPVSEAAPLVP